MPAGAARPASISFGSRPRPPTTARLPAVLANTSGFVYYVSITGITGAAAPDAGEGRRRRLRASSAIPICRSRSASASRTPRAPRRSPRAADGVVVGSALVEARAHFAARRQGGGRAGRRGRRLVASWPRARGVAGARGREAMSCHELDFERRSAENPLAAAARHAGKSVGQMPGERPARFPQGSRSEPDGGAGLRLSHGDRRRARASPRCSTTAPTRTCRSPRRSPTR